jgi:uncharacterized protein YjbI with pentapeptide repeats
MSDDPLAPRDPRIPAELTAADGAPDDETAVENTELGDFELAGRTFELVDATGSRFAGTRLAGSRWRRCTFHDCVLSGCDLANATFEQTGMRRVQLTGVRLTGRGIAGLRGAQVHVDDLLGLGFAMAGELGIRVQTGA